jgi:hypothetical protein
VVGGGVALGLLVVGADGVGDGVRLAVGDELEEPLEVGSPGGGAVMHAVRAARHIIATTTDEPRLFMLRGSTHWDAHHRVESPPIAGRETRTILRRDAVAWRPIPTR